MIVLLFTRRLYGISMPLYLMQILSVDIILFIMILHI